MEVERESPTNDPNLLQAENLDPNLSIEEEDHLRRSNKKVKNNHQSTRSEEYQQMIIDEVELVNHKSSHHRRKIKKLPCHIKTVCPSRSLF